MQIDKETYPLKVDNYYREVYHKTQIIIGHSGRKDMRHYDAWLNRKNGRYKKTSTYSIDLDGEIYEHFDPKYYSDFINKEQDKCSISITLVNPGWLKLLNNDKYIDWLGHIYNMKLKPFEKNWRNYRFWFDYTEKQYNSLKELKNYICSSYNIENKVIEHNVYDDNIDIFKGVTFRSNYHQELTDVNPSFEINKIV